MSNYNLNELTKNKISSALVNVGFPVSFLSFFFIRCIRTLLVASQLFSTRAADPFYYGLSFLRFIPTTVLNVLFLHFDDMFRFYQFAVCHFPNSVRMIDLDINPFLLTDLVVLVVMAVFNTKFSSSELSMRRFLQCRDTPEVPAVEAIMKKMKLII